MQRLLSISRSRKRALQVIADSLILIAVFIAAMWMRLESLNFLTNPQVWHVMIPVLPTTIYFFARLGFYRAVLRYIAGRALFTIFLGSLLSGLLMAAVAHFAELPIPVPVPLIYTMLTFLCIGGVRFGFRELINYSRNHGKERVAIYGAGASGRQLLQVLHQRNDYLPVAFIDDSKTAQGTEVGGLKVYSPSQISVLIRNNGVNVVLLAIPSASNARRQEILRSFENQPVVLQSVPGLDDIMAGKARIDQIGDIGIEDLLGRDSVPPRAELMGANIRGKVVMVTGAGGSIGSELCRQILLQGPSKLILYELSEPALHAVQQELERQSTLRQSTSEIVSVLGSVLQGRVLQRTMRRFGVNTVYHAAAYKHVPMLEHNIVEGIRNNVFGTRTAVDAAIRSNVASFIMISTDKSVRPTSIMGASKRLAEMHCQARATQGAGRGTTISMVRFGNVLDSSGSVIPKFRQQIARGGPITVTHPDVTRYFMTIPEAAQLVIQAGAMAVGGEVYVLDMGAPVRIVDLAAKMARLHGLRPVYRTGTAHAAGRGEIDIVFTKLRPGEKLHEELLIGNDPSPTDHPQIMSAREEHQSIKDLESAYDQLSKACDHNDVGLIRSILTEQRTGYEPSPEIVDLFWQGDDAVADLGRVSSVPGDRHLSLFRKKG